MFGLNKYLNKVYQIQWKFSPDLQKSLEDVFFVTFKQNEKGYFVIESITYTYMDILIGLEEKDFIITKVKNDIFLEILT